LGDLTCEGFGIEKLGIYCGRYALRLTDLALRRGLDAQKLQGELLAHERSVFPPWEDAVSMAVNAADPMLSSADRRAVGLLIVASETAVDQEKALSSWVHEALQLPEDCRNFELKHACMGTTDAIRMALGWLATLAYGRKALVISADRSLMAFGEGWETINGGAAAAVLLSAEPHVLLYQGMPGIYTRNITDVIRPTPRLETGNSQESLFGYLEALDGSLARYLELTPAARDYDHYFVAHIYHAPFPGMTYRAHRCVHQQLQSSVDRDEFRNSFEKRVLPFLEYNRRIGTSFGASTLISLACLIRRKYALRPGDCVSFYAYGAGSCGEFYGARVGADAAANAPGEDLEAALNARKCISVDEYEELERAVDDCIGKKDVDIRIDPNWTPRCGGQRLYALRHISNYVRSYGWIEA